MLDDAVRVTKYVRDIHKKAGLELKQFESNSPSLLEALSKIE